MSTYIWTWGHGDIWTWGHEDMETRWHVNMKAISDKGLRKWGNGDTRTLVVMDMKAIIDKGMRTWGDTRTWGHMHVRTLGHMDMTPWGHQGNNWQLTIMGHGDVGYVYVCSRYIDVNSFRFCVPLESLYFPAEDENWNGTLTFNSWRFKNLLQWST